MATQAQTTSTRKRKAPPKANGAKAPKPTLKTAPTLAPKPASIDFNDIFTQAIEHSGLRPLDAAKVLEAHSNQLAALGEANYHALETLRRIIALQAEILENTLEAGAQATREFQSIQSSGGGNQNLGEAFMQDVLDRAINSMRLLSESVAKANAEAITQANDQVLTTIQDIQRLGKQLKP